MYVYVLTSLTGRRRNAGRTVIVQGFEFGRRALIVTGIAFGASLIPAIVLTALFGPAAFILTPAVFILAAFLLYEQRSRKGMNLRMYQAINDKRKSDPNQFMICFAPAADGVGWGQVSPSSEPVRSLADEAPAPVWTNSAKRGRRISQESTGLSDLFESERPLNV